MKYMLLLCLIAYVAACGGIRVERGVKFREGGAIYETDGDLHRVRVGANADMVLNLGVFELGGSEYLDIEDGEISSTTELLLRIREELDEDDSRSPATYVEVWITLELDTRTERAQVCFRVLGQFTVEPRCEDLPWGHPDNEVTESTNGES